LVALSLMYTAALVGVAVFGLNMLFFALLAAATRLRRRRAPAGGLPPEPAEWPVVLVQLPIYNERCVAERLIDAVAALDYPPERLRIQVLDDSTDETSALVRARAASHRARGRHITHRQRANRAGYKAGALAAGLEAPEAEGASLVAVFDADFVPGRDFLRRTVPAFAADPRLGVVQARWEHLNADESALTQAEALALDAFFGVEQFARSKAGLILSFNGSAGVWRRAAIDAAGGWQGDTLAEDLDLSFRAQMGGWRLDYRPEVTAPAELPATVLAFKRQQFRWAKGTVQSLLKLTPALLRSRQPALSKLEGLLYMMGYVPHVLMLAGLALSLPVVVLLRGETHMPWGVLTVAGFGPPAMALLGQMFTRRDWWRRLAAFPVLVLVGVGLSLNSTAAIWEAVTGRRGAFLRTPKGGSGYALPVDWTTWAEGALALYALFTAALAVELAPGLVFMLMLYATGFGYLAALGLREGERARRQVERAEQAASGD
jgi:cellulose synthase/poly-beta-1,6-N-acetylglucosamine synthase-like glycosyltransferase